MAYIYIHVGITCLPIFVSWQLRSIEKWQLIVIPIKAHFVDFIFWSDILGKLFSSVEVVSIITAIKYPRRRCPHKLEIKKCGRTGFCASGQGFVDRVLWTGFGGQSSVDSLRVRSKKLGLLNLWTRSI